MSERSSSVPTVTSAAPPTAPEELVSYYASLSARAERWDHLRFGAFQSILPEYSWVLTWAEPEKHPEDFKRVKAALEEVRGFVFRGIDFSSIGHGLDIGCGYSSDLLRLGQEHRHLRLHGFNISPDQVALGRQRIREARLDDRITLFNLDSARNDFPGLYDLVMSFQVIHHIQDKASVFANIGRHLKNGGLGVMAEILSNMETPIDHPASTAYFVPRMEWAEELARNRLRVVECVDMSQEVSHFLHDEDFTSKYAYLAERHDEVTLHHIKGPHDLGHLLRKGLALYALLRVQKDELLLKEELLRINREKLSAPVLYAQVREGAPAVSAAPTAVRSAAPAAVPELAELLSASETERSARVEPLLTRWAARILQLSAEQVDLQLPLRRLGLDSLMALEMRHHLMTHLGLRVSPVDLLDGLTLGQLVARVVARQDGTAPPEGVPPPAVTAQKTWEEGEL